MRIMRSLIIVLLASAAAFAQTATQSRTRTHVQTLASEKFEGRMAGSPGGAAAHRPSGAAGGVVHGLSGGAGDPALGEIVYRRVGEGHPAD